MALIKGNNVAAPIVPYDTQDVHPTHVDEYGKGGYRIEDTYLKKYAIPKPRLRKGMWVKVLEDGKVWELKEVPAAEWIVGTPSTVAADWQLVNFGNNSPGVEILKSTRIYAEWTVVSGQTEYSLDTLGGTYPDIKANTIAFVDVSGNLQKETTPGKPGQYTWQARKLVFAEAPVGDYVILVYYIDATPSGNGFIYETIDGNGIPATPNAPGQVLRRKLTDDGYEFVTLQLNSEVGGLDPWLSDRIYSNVANSGFHTHATYLGRLFKSKIANNVGNQPPSAPDGNSNYENASWVEVSPSTLGHQQGTDLTGKMGDGTLKTFQSIWEEARKFLWPITFIPVTASVENFRLTEKFQISAITLRNISALTIKINAAAPIAHTDIAGINSAINGATLPMDIEIAATAYQAGSLFGTVEIKGLFNA